MKKFLIVLLLLLTLIPCFARTYTEEEFQEVYNALKETNDLLIESKETIADMQNQINALKEANDELITQLESTKTELQNTYNLLSKAEAELKNSSSIINKLNNEKILIGLGFAINTNFTSRINIGAKINGGCKVWLGHVVGEFAIFNDKSFTFGVSYNITF